MSVAYFTSSVSAGVEPIMDGAKIFMFKVGKCSLGWVEVSSVDFGTPSAVIKVKIV